MLDSAAKGRSEHRTALLRSCFSSHRFSAFSNRYLLHGTNIVRMLIDICCRCSTNCVTDSASGHDGQRREVLLHLKQFIPFTVKQPPLESKGQLNYRGYPPPLASSYSCSMTSRLIRSPSISPTQIMAFNAPIAAYRYFVRTPCFVADSDLNGLPRLNE